MTSLELLVAFTLLSTALSLAVPLVVHHGRLLASARHYRLAVDELTNQIERLTALPRDDVQRAIEELQSSSFTAERLPGAALSAQLEPDDLGERLTLSIVWNEPQRAAAPVRLVAWVMPDADGPSAPAEESTEP